MKNENLCTNELNKWLETSKSLNLLDLTSLLVTGNNYYANVNEVLEFYVSPFDMLTDLVKYAEMFRESNKDFYLAAQGAQVNENEITLVWKEGEETYERADVDEWDASDFSTYLAMWDKDFSVMTAIMQIEKTALLHKHVA